VACQVARVTKYALFCKIKAFKMICRRDKNYVSTEAKLMLGNKDSREKTKFN
jgi:hypothetical protein